MASTYQAICWDLRLPCRRIHVPGSTFYNDLLGVDPDDNPITMSPVGFRCETSLTTSSATIDGLTGTFNSYTPSESAPLPSATLIPMETAIPQDPAREVSAALTLQETIGFQALMDIFLTNTLLLEDPVGVGRISRDCGECFLARQHVPSRRRL